MHQPALAADHDDGRGGGHVDLLAQGVDFRAAKGLEGAVIGGDGVVVMARGHNPIALPVAQGGEDGGGLAFSNVVLMTFSWLGDDFALCDDFLDFALDQL